MSKLRTFLALFGALIALAVTSPALATTQYNSNNSTTGFDATATNTLPTGWVNISGAWRTRTNAPIVPSHTQSFGDTTNANASVAVYTGIAALADMEVTGTVPMTNTSGSGTGVSLGVRANAAGTSGYVCIGYVQSNSVQVQVYKEVSGVYTQISSAAVAAYALNTSDNVSLKASVVGSLVKCKAWSANTAEPNAWTNTATDSTITGTGYAWLYNKEFGSNAAGLTDFAVNDAPQGETNAISLTAPAPIQSGSSLTGVFTGTSPTGFNIAFDAGSYAAVSSPTIGSGTFSFSLPTLAGGYHQISVQAANATAETSATPAVNVIPPAIVFLPNNAAIYYPPGEWYVNGSASATTIASGAYFKTGFTGSLQSLSFDVSKMTSSPSEVYWNVDGQGWNLAYLSSGTVYVTMPSGTATWAAHTLQVQVKSPFEFEFPTGVTGQSWDPSSSPNSAIVFTGLSISGTAALLAPSVYPKKCLILGDSLTHTYKVLLGSGGISDADWTDSTLGWAYALGKALTCEVSIYGSIGQGFNHVGAGTTPAFPSTYNYIFAGVPRDLTVFTYIIMLQGQNDGTNNVVAQMDTVFNGITTVAPKVPVFVLEPLSGLQAAGLQTAIAAANAPSQFHYIDTTGFFNTAYSFDGLHPQGVADLNYIAPAMAAAIQPVIDALSGVYIPHIGGIGVN